MLCSFLKYVYVTQQVVIHRHKIKKLLDTIVKSSFVLSKDHFTMILQASMKMLQNITVKHYGSYLVVEV